MAICVSGLYGQPSGKIGKLVFYMLNGQPVCRLVGRAGKPSVNQLANRQSMSVTMDLLKPMSDFINVGFKLDSEGTVKNQHNLATSYNKKTALTGEYPNIKVDYSKVILSKGSLEMAKDLKVSKGEAGINLSWNDLITENGSYDDILMVMVNYPDKKQASSFLNVAKRKDGTCFIPVFRAEWMKNTQMEIYVCFKSANGKLISDTTYAGNLNGVAETEKEKAETTDYNAIKARYELISADYHKRLMENWEGKTESKAFRHLEREYLVLKKRLEHLPGAKDRRLGD